MAAFNEAAFDRDTFDVPAETVVSTTSTRGGDDVRRIWGLLRNPNLERLSREYRAWWRR